MRGEQEFVCVDKAQATNIFGRVGRGKERLERGNRRRWGALCVCMGCEGWENTWVRGEWAGDTDAEGLALAVVGDDRHGELGRTHGHGKRSLTRKERKKNTHTPKDRKK